MAFKPMTARVLATLKTLLQISVEPSLLRAATLSIVVALFLVTGTAATDQSLWSASELLGIKMLSISNLPALPRVPSNAVADVPGAAALGKALFFETRFSANGTVSCSSCHMPDRQFQDDLRVGHGIAEGTRRTMPLAGSAFHPFLFWDGRKDSLWSQALGPLENPVEHGADRAMVVSLIAANYRAEYEALFGEVPDLSNLPAHAAPSGTPEAVAAWSKLTSDQRRSINLVFANLGKAIEAFERTIPVPHTRFDDFAAALAAKDVATANDILTEAEQNGLRLFLGKGGCMACHRGPQFTDMKFHNVPLLDTSATTDFGRSAAAHILKDDPFNCLGEFSDAKLPYQCQPLRTMEIDLPEQMGAFKSPSLRGVAQRPPYMHNGKFATLHDVLVHYNDPPQAALGKSELRARGLTPQELMELEAFLLTLNVE